MTAQAQAEGREVWHSVGCPFDLNSPLELRHLTIPCLIVKWYRLLLATILLNFKYKHLEVNQLGYFPVRWLLWYDMHGVTFPGFHRCCDTTYRIVCGCHLIASYTSISSGPYNYLTSHIPYNIDIIYT